MVIADEQEYLTWFFDNCGVSSEHRLFLQRKFEHISGKQVPAWLQTNLDTKDTKVSPPPFPPQSPLPTDLVDLLPSEIKKELKER